MTRNGFEPGQRRVRWIHRGGFAAVVLVLMGLFVAAVPSAALADADLSVIAVDVPDPVSPGNTLTYTITLDNAGPDPADIVNLMVDLMMPSTFVSLSAPGGWSCSTPPVGATGPASCTNPSMAVGSAVFTMVVAVDSGATSDVVNFFMVSSLFDPNEGNDGYTAVTTLMSDADLSIAVTDTPDPVVAGAHLTYTVTLANAGPNNAPSASWSDALPAGSTFVSLAAPGSWSCTTPGVGAAGTVSCSSASMPIGSAVFTLVAAVGTGVITNTAVASSTVSDSNPGNNSGTASTTVTAQAGLSITVVDTPDPVAAGAHLTYTVTLANAGPSDAPSASWSDTLPAGSTFVSLAAPGGWSCTTPVVGAAGTVSCSNLSMTTGSADFTLVVAVRNSVAPGTIISNTVAATSLATDPTPGDLASTTSTTVTDAVPIPTLAGARAMLLAAILSLIAIAGFQRRARGGPH